MSPRGLNVFISIAFIARRDLRFYFLLKRLLAHLSLVQTGFVAHGDELTYEFYSNGLKNLPQSGSPAEKMIRIFTTLLTNFAKDGYVLTALGRKQGIARDAIWVVNCNNSRNPTSRLDDNVNVIWEARGEDDNYMNINQDLRMEQGLLKDRVDFWKNLYRNVLA